MFKRDQSDPSVNLSAQRPKFRLTCDDPDRRDVLCGSGAIGLTAILGLLGGARPARAQALRDPFRNWIRSAFVS